MKHTISLLAATVLTSAAVTGAAELRESLPGAACVQQSQPVMGVRYSATTGSANNTSSGTATLLCPVTRTSLLLPDVDDDGEFEEGARFAATVNRNNSSSTLGALSCRFVGCPNDSVGCTNGPLAQATGTGIQTLSEEGVDGDDFFGYSFISCTVPGISPAGAQSSLISYRVILEN